MHEEDEIAELAPDSATYFTGWEFCSSATLPALILCAEKTSFCFFSDGTLADVGSRVWLVPTLNPTVSPITTPVLSVPIQVRSGPSEEDEEEENEEDGFPVWLLLVIWNCAGAVVCTGSSTGFRSTPCTTKLRRMPEAEPIATALTRFVSLSSGCFSALPGASQSDGWRSRGGPTKVVPSNPVMAKAIHATLLKRLLRAGRAMGACEIGVIRVAVVASQDSPNSQARPPSTKQNASVAEAWLVGLASGASAASLQTKNCKPFLERPLCRSATKSAKDSRAAWSKTCPRSPQGAMALKSCKL